MKIGLISTILAGTENIDSFLNHYRHIGISHLYIIFDGNDLRFPPGTTKSNDFTVINGPTLDEYRTLETDLPKDPSVFSRSALLRQILNFHLAIKIAAHDGVEWVIHLDFDEQLVANVPLDSALARTGDACGQLYIRNSEIFLESGWKQRPGAMVMFKNNPHFIHPDVLAEYFKITGKRFYFTAYTIGKSFVRTDAFKSATCVHRNKLKSGYFGTWADDSLQLLHFCHSEWEIFQNKFNRLKLEKPKHWDDSQFLDFYKEGAEKAWESPEVLQRFFEETLIHKQSDAAILQSLGIVSKPYECRI